jgi:RNA polymerase sigma-70 factor (ECF subfamily)
MESRFEQACLPHLAAAYNLARWLTHDDRDAEDVVQEAYLRALRFFDTFRGGDGRAWLLAIVRNACHDWLRRNRPLEESTPFDEDVHSAPVDQDTPERTALRSADREMLRRALSALPAAWREVIVLRELEGLSYKEIAEVAGIPIGTVMSRLARARTRLQQSLAAELKKD